MFQQTGDASYGHCLPKVDDISLLDRFQISPSFRRFKNIEMIIWKPPTHPCIKVNTDGSLRNSNAACGGIFHDHSRAFMGCFSTNIDDYQVLKATIMGFIISMEMAVRHHWKFI